MIVNVTYNRGKLSILPDPVVVDVGTFIEWRLVYTDRPVQNLTWTIYFQHGSPFPGKKDRFEVETPPRSIGLPPLTNTHRGQTTQSPAVSPGDYKYGVRLVDPGLKTVIADDDPRLIVNVLR